MYCRCAAGAAAARVHALEGGAADIAGAAPGSRALKSAGGDACQQRGEINLAVVGEDNLGFRILLVDHLLDLPEGLRFYQIAFVDDDEISGGDLLTQGADELLVGREAAAVFQRILGIQQRNGVVQLQPVCQQPAPAATSRSRPGQLPL